MGSSKTRYDGYLEAHGKRAMGVKSCIGKRVQWYVNKKTGRVKVDSEDATFDPPPWPITFKRFKLREIDCDGNIGRVIFKGDIVPNVYADEGVYLRLNI